MTIPKNGVFGQHQWLWSVSTGGVFNRKCGSTRGYFWWWHYLSGDLDAACGTAGNPQYLIFFSCIFSIHVHRRCAYATTILFTVIVILLGPYMSDIDRDVSEVD